MRFYFIIQTLKKKNQYRNIHPSNIDYFVVTPSLLSFGRSLYFLFSMAKIWMFKLRKRLENHPTKPLGRASNLYAYYATSISKIV